MTNTTTPRKPRKNAAVVENPRIGVLTPQEFEEIASRVFGGRGWQRAMVRGTGWSPSTITRYLQGRLEVPQDVAVMLEMMQTLRNAGLPLPDAFSMDTSQAA